MAAFLRQIPRSLPRQANTPQPHSWHEQGVRGQRGPFAGSQTTERFLEGQAAAKRDVRSRTRAVPRRPAGRQEAGPLTLVAVKTMMCWTSRQVRHGRTCSISAIIPAASGAAADVPVWPSVQPVPFCKSQSVVTLRGRGERPPVRLCHEPEQEERIARGLDGCRKGRLGKLGARGEKRWSQQLQCQLSLAADSRNLLHCRTPLGGLSRASWGREELTSPSRTTATQAQGRLARPAAPCPLCQPQRGLLEGSRGKAFEQGAGREAGAAQESQRGSPAGESTAARNAGPQSWASRHRAGARSGLRRGPQALAALPERCATSGGTDGTAAERLWPFARGQLLPLCDHTETRAGEGERGQHPVRTRHAEASTQSLTPPHKAFRQPEEELWMSLDSRSRAKAAGAGPKPPLAWAMSNPSISRPSLPHGQLPPSQERGICST